MVSVQHLLWLAIFHLLYLVVLAPIGLIWGDRGLIVVLVVALLAYIQAARRPKYLPDTGQLRIHRTMLPLWRYVALDDVRDFRLCAPRTEHRWGPVSGLSGISAQLCDGKYVDICESECLTRRGAARWRDWLSEVLIDHRRRGRAQ